MQARSKGCILLSYFTEKLKEVSSVSLVRKLIRISVLIFWLGSCPTNFYKVDEMPITILCCLNIRMIIYLDDMLLKGYSVEGRVIFLVQHLDFIINCKKSVLTPEQSVSNFWC